MNIDTNNATRGDTLPIVVAPALVFAQTVGSDYRYAEHGPVTYALREMIDINDGLEVTLVAKAGSHFRRLGRWLHVSTAHDLTHARRLVREHHDTMLRLAAPTVKA